MAAAASGAALIRSDVRATGRAVKVPGSTTDSREPVIHRRPAESMMRAGADRVLEAKSAWMVAVILPVAGSACISLNGVSTHTALRLGTICGIYPPLSTGKVWVGWSESWLIEVMWSTSAQPIQMPCGPGNEAQAGPAPGIGAAFTITSWDGSILYRYSWLPENCGLLGDHPDETVAVGDIGTQPVDREALGDSAAGRVDAQQQTGEVQGPERSGARCHAGQFVALVAGLQRLGDPPSSQIDTGDMAHVMKVHRRESGRRQSRHPEPPGFWSREAQPGAHRASYAAPPARPNRVD